jgi:hypothetical protein
MERWGVAIGSYKSVLDRNLNAKHTGNHEKGQAAQGGVHY